MSETQGYQPENGTLDPDNPPQGGSALLAESGKSPDDTELKPYRAAPGEALLLKHVELTGSLVLACRHPDICGGSMKNPEARDIARKKYNAARERKRVKPEFAKRVKAAEDIFLDTLDATVKAKAPANPNLALKILERKRPDEWGQQSKVEVSGNIEKPLNVRWHFVRPGEVEDE